MLGPEWPMYPFPGQASKSDKRKSTSTELKYMTSKHCPSISFIHVINWHSIRLVTGRVEEYPMAMADDLDSKKLHQSFLGVLHWVQDLRGDSTKIRRGLTKPPKDHCWAFLLKSPIKECGIWKRMQPLKPDPYLLCGTKQTKPSMSLRLHIHKMAMKIPAHNVARIDAMNAAPGMQTTLHKRQTLYSLGNLIKASWNLYSLRVHPNL